MAYGVTPEGFVAKPYAQIRSDLEDLLRNGDATLGIAGIDPLLDTSDQTPMGQIVSIVAGALAEIWELGAATYAARYPDSAADSALDEVASLTGTERNPATKAQVVGQVTLTASTTLPAGSVANLAGRPNDRFVTLTEVVDGGAGGTYDVTFEAEDAGDLDVLANQLTEIAEPVAGWTAVDNSAGATVIGTDAETDSELRTRRRIELAASGSTNVDAIRAQLIQLASVQDVAVTEDLVAHTIAVVTRGGVAQDVWDTIFAARAAGIQSVGSSSGTVTDSQGVDHTEAYTPAAGQAIHVDITVETTSDFDATNGPDDIKDAIAAYINGLGIGDDVIADRVRNAAYSITGVYKVTALSIGIGAPAGGSDITISATQYATCDVGDVDVTVT